MSQHAPAESILHDLKQESTRTHDHLQGSKQKNNLLEDSQHTPVEKPFTRFGDTGSFIVVDEQQLSKTDPRTLCFVPDEDKGSKMQEFVRNPNQNFHLKRDSLVECNGSQTTKNQSKSLYFQEAKNSTQEQFDDFMSYDKRNNIHFNASKLHTDHEKDLESTLLQPVIDE